MGAQRNYQYKPKEPDQIWWQRERERLRTDARLFIGEAVDRALYELASMPWSVGTADDSARQFFLVKHVLGTLCGPGWNDVLPDAVAALAPVESKALQEAANHPAIEQGAGS